MYYLSDVANFARTLGAKDKQRRKRQLAAIGAAGLGMGATGYLGVRYGLHELF